MHRLGAYELDGLIGRGSMGLVYRARQRPRGQLVALKRLRGVADGAVVERLREEGTALARLGHPNVLKVVEVIADEEGLAVVMNLASGGSLADVLARHSRVPPEESAALAAKAARALEAAHALGILHGDVKPSNILMDTDGEPLLADFGLSRWTTTAVPSGGEVVGTAEYLDPVVAGGAQAGPASDVYSLGIVCYQMLTGRLPYCGVTPSATLRCADRGGAQPLVEAAPDVPAGLAAVVEVAMSRRPRERPASAGELADALRAAVDQDGTREAVGPGRFVPIGDMSAKTGSAHGPRPIRPRRRASKHSHEVSEAGRRPSPLVVAIGVATVLVVVALTGAAFGRGEGARGAARCGTARTAVLRQAGPTTSAVTFLADVTGNGCPVLVSWSSGVITLPSVPGRAADRFALGQVGDELLLGDWDCGRAATPALYRPATGLVFYFAGWAQPGRDLPPRFDDATAITDGVPRVVHHGPGGCDRVEVAPPELSSR